MLGQAGRVVVTKDTTTVTHGAGAQAAIDDRIAQIRREIDETDSDWDREKLQERLAKLAGGVGVIRVGAATEVELKERKHRIEDAIAATRAAVEEGIIAGGGAALLHAAFGARRRPRPVRRRGHRALPSCARRWPSRCTGSRPTPVTKATSWWPSVREMAGNSGLDAATGEYGDLIAAGIVDPVKVTKAALANAASVASLLLTTQSLIVDKPEEADDHAADGHSHGGHGHGHSHGPGF